MEHSPVPCSTIDISLPTESPKSSQVYLVRSSEGWAMVDAGWNSPSAWAELQVGLDSQGVSPADLRYIVLTHAHPDHVGLVSRLARSCDARFVMHRREYDLAMSYLDGTTSYARTMNAFLAGADAPASLMYPDSKTSPTPEIAEVPRERFLLVEGTETLRLGERALQLLWTPGHSCGHLSVFEKSSRTLFTGDSLLGDMAPNVEFGLKCGTDPMADTLRTLRKLDGLPAVRTLPAHGGPVPDLHFSCNKLIGHFLKRILQAFELCRDGATCRECLARSNWRFGAEDALHPGKSRIVTFQMLGYLELLVGRGLLSRDLAGGVYVYRWSPSACGRPVPPDADELRQMLGI